MVLTISSSSSFSTYAPLVSPIYRPERDLELTIKPKVLEVLIKIPSSKSLITEITDYIPVNIHNYGPSRVGLSISVDFSDPTHIKLITNNNLTYTVCSDEEINFLIWIRPTIQMHSVDLVLSVKLEELFDIVDDSIEHEASFQFFSTELIVKDPFKIKVIPEYVLSNESVNIVYKAKPVQVHKDVEIVSVKGDFVEFKLSGNLYKQQVSLTFDKPLKPLIILSSCASEGLIAEPFEMNYYLYNSTSDIIKCSIDCLFSTCCGNLGLRPIDLEIAPLESKKATLLFFPLKTYPKKFPPPIVEFSEQSSLEGTRLLEYEYRHVSGPISFLFP
jgi:hypothetical protein